MSDRRGFLKQLTIALGGMAFLKHFKATPAPKGYTTVAGDKLTLTIGAYQGQEPRVIVTDEFGNVVARSPVTFTAGGTDA